MKQKKSSNAYAVVLMLLSICFLSLQACKDENPVATAELGNTYWRLTELAGKPVVTAKGQREMKITLRGEQKVTGFGGCNSFFGAYEHDEAALSFSQLAATRMFCADVMDKESRFMKALATTKTYEITGQSLQLFDADRKSLVRFEAVYLK